VSLRYISSDMNANDAAAVAVPSDTDLVARSLVGNSEAFGQIVARYQSLICSLAYSATGSLGESEDLAQETFITAWKHLRHLREAAKLRSWLCGIARNRIRNFLRREGREPAHKADQFDAEHDSIAHEPIPAEHAISKEEASILWRSLERLPEVYREPLILFYREGESVQRVASELELSEDAVKQRLSRGRKLLAEEVTAFVEGALKQSAPGKAFTLGVLAALPLMTTSAKAAAIAATAAKGSAAAKTAGLAGLIGAIGSPILILLGTYFGYKLEIDTATSPAAREFVKKFYRLFAGCIAGFMLVIVSFIFLARPLLPSHTALYAGLLFGLGVIYIFVVAALAIWARRCQQTIRQKEFAERSRTSAGQATICRTEPLFEYRSKLSLLGLPLIHIRLRGGIERGPVKAWIAAGDSAIGVLFALGGIAVAPISFGGFAAGLLTLGGCGIGLLSLSGFSIGLCAIGGFAVGWYAFGGCAVGWSAAQGAVAVAHEFANGAVALAPHANDEVAQTFFANSSFFRLMHHLILYIPWLGLLAFFPLVLQRYSANRRSQSA
jgi:RNA polymerase sigma factor (sigma-70 family)